LPTTDNAQHLIDTTLKEPYCRFLGVRSQTVESGSARLELPYRDEISNPGRQVHGGVMSSMLGMAGRVAALSVCDLAAPLSVASVELNVTYLSSAVGEGMVAEGRVARRGKELTHVNCSLISAAGKYLASAMVVFRTVSAEDPTPAPVAVERGPAQQGEMPSIARALAGAPFISGLGIRLDRFIGGRSELSMPARDDILAAAGALAAWSNVRPKPGMKVSTVSIDVNFCSAPAGKDAIAYAHTVGRRKEIFFNRVDVLTPDNVPVAFGSVIYRIVLPE
jgi:acyl-CoA thioesterase